MLFDWRGEPRGEAGGGDGGNGARLTHKKGFSMLWIPFWPPTIGRRPDTVVQNVSLTYNKLLANHVPVIIIIISIASSRSSSTSILKKTIIVVGSNWFVVDRVLGNRSLMNWITSTASRVFVALHTYVYWIVNNNSLVVLRWRRYCRSHKFLLWSHRPKQLSPFSLCLTSLKRFIIWCVLLLLLCIVMNINVISHQ